MSKPTPGKELIHKFTGTIIGNNGKMGTSKLKDALGWSENDFDWVKTYLIDTGQVKVGRGRGGSIQINTPEEQKTQQTKIQETEAAKQEAKNEEQEEIFNLDAIKNKYKLLPEDITAFKPGMKISRLPTHLYTNEEHVWKYMNHYIVTGIKDDNLIVVPRNVKGAEPIQTKPVRFYAAK